MNADSTDGPDELQRLQSELSSRRSIVHYAHAAVSLLGTLILGSAYVKLYSDQARLAAAGRPESQNPAHLVLAAAAALLAYALVRAFLGRRRMKEETRQYERMLALRKKQHLDDPSALLPK